MNRTTETVNHDQDGHYDVAVTRLSKRSSRQISSGGAAVTVIACASLIAVAIFAAGMTVQPPAPTVPTHVSAPESTEIAITAATLETIETIRKRALLQKQLRDLRALKVEARNQGLKISGLDETIKHLEETLETLHPLAELRSQ